MACSNPFEGVAAEWPWCRPHYVISNATASEIAKRHTKTRPCGYPRVGGERIPFLA